MTTFRQAAISLAVAITTIGLVACGSSDDDGPTAAAPMSVGDTVALTASSRLISFNRTAPGTQVGSAAITGLKAGDALVGIDMRPADGKLYGLGSMGNLYLLDAATGIATLKVELKAATGDSNPFVALTGTSFGIDFNPVVDRLRVVSDSGMNLRINVDTGDTITDGNVAAASAALSAVAYTNGFAGATSTGLFALDAATGRLVKLDPPNDGVTDAGVPLGVLAEAGNGFDIDPRTNTGYASLRVGGETALYTINLGSTANVATRVGVIAGGETIRGLSLAPVTASAAAPSAIALTSDNRLAAFDPKTPNTITATTVITGLGTGENMVGIDFRPKDGLLYGVSSSGRLYTIDPSNGATTLRAVLTADATDTTAPFAGLAGTAFSVDFNPVADRLRVISNTGQSLRIAVETATTNGVTVAAGATTTDGAINRASGAASVLAAAYNNNFAGATSTALFNLEQNTDQLTLQSPPNNGVLADIGPLGLEISGSGGFDIAGGDNGLVLAALRAGNAGPFSLYTVSLSTGALTLYRNTSGNAALSVIGGATGPVNLIDLAIRF